jgi:hypothetical protein
MAFQVQLVVARAQALVSLMRCGASADKLEGGLIRQLAAYVGMCAV